MNTAIRAPRAQGFSLIEALVAVLLTSFLLLVLARMTVWVPFRLQEARTQAFAIHQMQSMAAAVAANRGYWAGKPGATVTLTSVSAAGGPDCEAGPCSAEQFARYEVARWGLGLAARMTSPAGTVSCASTGPGAAETACMIELAWHIRGSRPTDPRSQLVLSFVP